MSAPAEKSVSSTNCPILASGTIGSSVNKASVRAAAERNKPAACFTHCPFHLAIELGRTSNFRARFVSAYSRFMPAKATFTLNTNAGFRQTRSFIFTPPKRRSSVFLGGHSTHRAVRIFLHTSKYLCIQATGIEARRYRALQPALTRIKHRNLATQQRKAVIH